MERHDDRLTLVYPYIAGAQTLQEIMSRERKSELLMHLMSQSGELVGSIHSLGVKPWQECTDLVTHANGGNGGTLDKFLHLSPKQYALASGGELVSRG